MRLGSLFSGIGGIDLGFQRAGFEIAWQVEIDKACRSVLARHWPDVPRFGDIREVGKKQLSKVDVIAGGFPCQDLSVAGRRGGIVGERSGLYFEMVRIIDELRPGYFVWENVPGLLSSYTALNPPPDNPADGDRWDLAERSCFEAVLTAIHGIGFSGCWRSLDAQFFGVPQRRERVFGVFARGRSGAEHCAEILSLTTSLQGHPPSRQETGQAVAATLRGRSSSRGVSEPGRGGEDDSNLVAFNWQAGGSEAMIGGKSDLVSAISCHQTPAIAHLAPALRGSGVGTERAGDTRGQDCVVVANEDGTGRGTPIVACDTYNLTVGGDVAASMTCESGSHASGSKVITPFAFQTRIARNGRGQPKETCDALTSAEGGSHADSKPHVATMQGVRRLTPRECERLQGLPDDWTRWLADGREQKDGPRYKQIGNGVAVPCLEWIARRILEATA